MTRKIKWPSMEELLKLKIRSHDEFGQMQPLWFLEDLERLQGIKQPRNPKPLPIRTLSDEELARLYPRLGPPWWDAAVEARKKKADSRKKQRRRKKA
jgi:hypothetical protein